ncbi:MAG: RDD family protein, partial [Myxococcota bacterium]
GARQRRVFARVFDLIIFLALALAVQPLGPALALLYVLVADAIWPGQSPGKRLFGVTVLRTPSGKPGTLWTSILRNLPMAVALLLALIPMVNVALFPTLGLLLLALESWLTRIGPRGRRMGDVLADCYVAEIAHPPQLPPAPPSSTEHG